MRDRFVIARFLVLFLLSLLRVADQWPDYDEPFQ